MAFIFIWATYVTGVGLLICLTVLIDLLEIQLPLEHNTVPVIGAYYAVTFILVSLSLAISAITNNIANRATRLSQPPGFLKKVKLYEVYI